MSDEEINEWNYVYKSIRPVPTSFWNRLRDKRALWDRGEDYKYKRDEFRILTMKPIPSELVDDFELELIEVDEDVFWSGRDVNLSFNDFVEDSVADKDMIIKTFVKEGAESEIKSHIYRWLIKKDLDNAVTPELAFDFFNKKAKIKKEIEQ